MPACAQCNRSYEGASDRCPHCNAPLANEPDSGSRDLATIVLELLDAGRKIEAIRIYRRDTGASLADAQRAIERLERAEKGLPAADDRKAGSLPTTESEAALLGLLASGQKIEAIRRYREQNHCDLREAKQAVEALAERHGLAGVASRGCLGLLLMAAGGAGGLAAIWRAWA